MDLLTARRQEFAEEMRVERAEHQPLRAAGGAGHDAHVGGPKAMVAQPLARTGSGEDLQGLHRAGRPFKKRKRPTRT
ncbi:hypothetical protein ACFJIX_15605 [Roseateles sp. UC29_93]|uniref:hypothetical protein n=1 Tax=Roseateles sp. UC29_93 TaxID=3350177 RepID=UPI00366DD1C3